MDLRRPSRIRQELLLIKLEKERYEQCKPSGLLYVAVAAALCGAMSMGTTVGWSSPALPDMERNNSRPHISEDDTKVRSLMGSSMNLGGLFGALIGGSLANWLGRRTCLSAISVPFLLSWAPIIFGHSVASIILGRLLIGFCGGICSAVVPMYVCEVSPVGIRGRLGSLFQLCSATGVLLISVAGWCVPWRWISAIGALPILPLIFVMPFMPESPVWLLQKGSAETDPYNGSSKARISLARLRTLTSPIDFELKQLAKNDTSASGDQDEDSNLLSRTWYVIRQPDGWKPLLLCIGLMICQQCSGIMGIVFFQKDIFISASEELNANLATVIVLITMVATTAGSSMLVDHLGRKLLLTVSAAGNTTSLALLGGFYYLAALDQDWADAYKWIPVLCLMIFLVGYSAGYGPVPWCMVAELAPSHVRGLVTSASITINWITAFLITHYLASLQDSLGMHGAFWLLSGFSFCGLLYAGLVLPETSGKSLAEIQALYTTKKPKHEDGKLKKQVSKPDLIKTNGGKKSDDVSLPITTVLIVQNSQLDENMNSIDLLS